MALPLRIIGTTGQGGTQSQAPEVEAGSRQIAEQSLARGTQAVQAAGEGIQRSFEIQQQTAATINQQAAQQRGASPRFAEALGSLAKAAEVFGELFGARKEQQAKMQERLDSELDEQQKVFALQALQPVVENARSIIQAEGYERGVPRVREMAIASLGAFENLAPETVQSLMSGIFTDLNRINEDMWNEGQRNLREAREAATDVALERGKIQVTAITARLAERGAYLSPEEQYEAIREAEEVFTEMEEFQNLDPINQARMRADMYRFIGSAYQEGSEAQQALFSVAQNHEQAYNMLQGVQLAYDTGQLTAEQRQAEIQRINLLYGTDITPWGFQDEMKNRLTEGQLYGDYMQLQQQQLYAEAGPLAALEVGKTVAAIAQGAASIDSVPEGPYRDQIEAALETYQKTEADLSSLRSRTTAINAELTQISQQARLAQAFARMSPEDQQRAGSEYQRAYDNYNTIQIRERELRQEALDVQNRMTTLQQVLIPYGLHQGAGRQGEFYNSPEAQRQRTEAAAVQAQQQAEGTQAFRPGDGATAAQARPLAALPTSVGGLEAGTPIPFVPGAANRVMTITSGYLAGRGGGRVHAGVDFAPNGGDNGGFTVAAVRSGRVTHAACQDTGWGCYVWVEDAQGNTAVYAHLTGLPRVQVGDTVSQGTPLGTMGNTGGSRGAHLHFSVLKPGARGEGNGRNTLDPLQYIRDSRNEATAVAPRGLGMPPTGTNQTSSRPAAAAPQGISGPAPVRNAPVVVASGPPPRGAYILPDGSAYIYAGAIYAMNEEAASLVNTRRQNYQSSIRPIGNTPAPTANATGGFQPTNAPQVFHGANPVRNNRYSNDITDYGDIRQFNNPNNNYGYEALAQDHAFRRKVHEVANELGIPAVWLVDVMAFETGGDFSPSVPNAGGSGCYGLIQFCPDRRGGSTKTVNGRVYNLHQLARMSRSDQMDIVLDYFKEGLAANRGSRFEHAHQVLLMVWGGSGNAFRNAADVRNLDDGDIRFHQYIRRLGEHGGRRYWTPYDQVSSEEVHDTMVAGCASCAQQASLDTSQFIAHIGEAPLLSMIG